MFRRLMPSLALTRAPRATTMVAAATHQWLSSPTASRASVGQLGEQRRWFSASPLLACSASSETAAGSSSSNADSGGATVLEVSAGTFDTEVVQSKQAIACLFYANTPTCNQYIDQSKRLVSDLNSDTAYKWVKLCLVNGDTNSNLAAAFSVQRTKLPVMIFMYGGTIVDRLNGFVAEDRAIAVFQKYKLYYEEKANVVLGGGSTMHPIPTAAAAHLNESTTVDNLKQMIARSLIGRDTVQCIPLDIAKGYSSSTESKETLNRQLEAVDVLKAQIEKGKSQSQLELKKLRTQLGIDTKKISEEELMASYYTSTQYMNAAMIEALDVLFHCRQNVVDRNLHGRTAARRLAEVTQKYSRAVQHFEFRRVTALCEALIVRVALLSHKTGEEEGTGKVVVGDHTSRAEASATPSERLPSSMTLGSDEEDISLFDSFHRWIEVVDPAYNPAVIDTEVAPLPSTTFEEMLACVRNCFLEAKKEAKDRKESKGDLVQSKAAKALESAALSHSQRRLELMKRFYVASLQCFPADSPEARSYRSRLASFLY